MIRRTARLDGGTLHRNERRRWFTVRRTAGRCDNAAGICHESYDRPRI